MSIIIKSTPVVIDKLCDRGCNQQAKFITSRGIYQCTESHNNCPIVKEKKKVKQTPEKLQEMVLKVKKTKELLYGDPYYTNREKGLITLQKRYGVLNPGQTEEARMGREKFNNDVYRKEKAKEKAKQTILERYGVDNIFKDKEYIQNQLEEKYGVRNPSQIPGNRNKVRQTSLERYGVEWPTITEKVKNSRRQSNIKKYGGPYPQHSEEIRKKTKDTCLKIYGYETPLQAPIVKNKIKKVMIERYGVESLMLIEKFKQQLIQKSLKRYGVKWPSQDPIIAERQRAGMRRSKIYILPSGKSIKLQGYEPQALDILLKIYNENDVYVGRNVPRITYTYEEKEHKHFPDFYIPKENKIIEVKSVYTIKDPKVLPKFLAGLKSEYIYEIWVIDSDDLSIINKEQCFYDFIK